MATFNSFADSPVNSIQNEGQDITLKLTRTSPTTARISWNIPTPMDGCADGTQAYDGIVLLLDNVPAHVLRVPQWGQTYTADPTADRNLHAGDKIDTALVVGAYYNDKTTTFVDITGLSPNTPYYVSGYAVDNVLRYHVQGVHAYTLDYGNKASTTSPYGDDQEPDTAAYQIVDIKATATDPTGLYAATPYKFDINVDGTTHTITVNGTDAATYADLVDALNKQLAKLDSPSLSNGFPNTGAYYWNDTLQKLYQWDGNQNVEKQVIVDTTDPSVPVAGEYWFDTTSEVLNKYDGFAWIPQTVINYSQDPTALNCDDYWFTGTAAYSWNGTVWCPKTLWNQAIDPSLPPTLTCPTYWYDTVNEYLYEWNENSLEWVLVDAIMWATDPTVVVNGDYWFDVTNTLVKQWDGATWNDAGAVIGDEPTLPANGTLWFDTDTQELFQWNAGTTTWDLLTIKVWEFEPNNPPACSVWWNTTTDDLYTWNTQTSGWALISNFVQSAIDPSQPPTLTDMDVWYNTVEEQLYHWDGIQWVAVTFINHLADPTLPNIDDVWYNTTTGVWSVWSGTWGVITVQELPADPYAPVAGDFWFDSMTDTLYQWNGAAWTSLLYSTTSYVPATGAQFFNTATDLLMEWDGTMWVEATPPVLVTFDENGDLKFTSGTLGSTSIIAITDTNLFKALQPQTVVILTAVLGTDGLVGIPTYEQLGIGDDGSADERRELIDSIRAQFGYPQVQVELTKFQFDQAVNAAIEEYRRRSSGAYKRGFMFFDLTPGIQQYKLTNKTLGLHTIVSIMNIYRVSSSAFGPAAIHSPYEQIMLQYLYQSGKYDLVSFHLVNEYVETMNQLFANDIMFHWNEADRLLFLHQTPRIYERVLLDVVLERHEQELIKDRYAKPWIEKWAMSEAKMMLSNIRGKYASLPGAGGGIALNAAELSAQAREDQLKLIEEVDQYISNDVETFGMSTAFVIG